MSIKELEKYAKDNNKTKFEALIDLMETKPNALDYLAEFHEHDLYHFKIRGMVSKEQKEIFLRNIVNSEPSKSERHAQEAHQHIEFLYRDRYEHNHNEWEPFFQELPNKLVFDSFIKIKTTVCKPDPDYMTSFTDLSKIALKIFKKEPSVIANEQDLLLFLNNQIENQENYIKLYKSNIDSGYHNELEVLYFKNYRYIDLINDLYDLCHFDPDQTIRQFDILNRIIESGIIDYKYYDRTDFGIYSLCFVEDLSYEDLRNKLNSIDRKYLGIEIQYKVFKKDPKIFDDEETVKNFIIPFIERLQKQKMDYNEYKDFKSLGMEQKFIDFIDELQQNLTIDVVEVLKNDPKLSELYEFQKLRNELANF